MSLFKIVSIMGMLVFSLYVFAADEQRKDEIKYYRMYPDVVTNLKSVGEPVFILARVELAASGLKNLQLIKDNEPLLRDQLILLFNSKNKEQIESVKQRRVFKKKALELLQEKMKKETGENVITQLLFTRFQVE
jgi:flagellar protein FliL